MRTSGQGGAKALEHTTNELRRAPRKVINIVPGREREASSYKSAARSLCGRPKKKSQKKIYINPAGAAKSGGSNGLNIGGGGGGGRRQEIG